MRANEHPVKGLCSRYIRALEEGSQLTIGLKRNKPPPCGDIHARRPLLAIATGTGIAPIVSLLQERQLFGENGKGPALLFFGCRSRNADFYAHVFLESYNRLTLIPAFSRDPIRADERVFLDPYAKQNESLVKPEIVLSAEPASIGPHNTPWTRSFEYDRGKMYVQHQIRRHAKEVCQLVKQARDFGVPPIIMICGNAGRMPVSVRQALEDALIIGTLAKDNDEAKQILQDIGIWMETW